MNTALISMLFCGVAQLTVGIAVAYLSKLLQHCMQQVYTLNIVMFMFTFLIAKFCCD